MMSETLKQKIANKFLKILDLKIKISDNILQKNMKDDPFIGFLMSIFQNSHEIGEVIVAGILSLFKCARTVVLWSADCHCHI